MSRRAAPPPDIAPEAFFRDWAPAAALADPERRAQLGGLDARIQFDLAGEGGGTFFLHVAGGNLDGGSGPIETPDLTLRTDLETWRALNAGSIKAPTAIMKGLLKFEGSVYLALKIHFILG